MQMQYERFQKLTVKLTDKAPEITILIIPEGNEWGKLMGIEVGNTYISAGKPVLDTHPPDTIFIKQETLSLNDGPLRLFNAVLFASLLSIIGRKIIFVLSPEFLTKEMLAKEILETLGETTEIASKEAV